MLAALAIVGPAQELRGDQARELLRACRRPDPRPAPIRRSLHVGQPDDLHQLLLELLDDAGGRGGGREQPRPQPHVEIRARRPPPWSARQDTPAMRSAEVTASALILPAFRWPETGGASASATSTSPPTHGGQHLAAALVGDVLERRAGLLLEQLGGELEGGRRARIVGLRRVRLGVGHQLRPRSSPARRH